MKHYIAAVATVVAVLLAWYLRNLSEPDLKYQMSSPIQTEVEGIGIRVVQQIEIANVGRAAAHPVQIRFRKRVGRLTVIKDSEADSYRQFDTPTGAVELVYDTLRPNGRLKIVTSGDTLAEQDVEIRDQQRPATLALASQERGWSVAASYVLWAILALYGWLSLRSGAKWVFDHEARYSPAELLRRRRLVMLVSRSDWESYQTTATDQMRRVSFLEPKEVASWEVYRLLDSKTPPKVPEDDWVKTVPKLTGALIERIESVAVQGSVSSDLGALRKLLDAEKPSAVLEERWQPLLQRIGSLYVSAAIANTARWSTTGGLLKACSEIKPTNLDEGTWSDYQARLRSLYYAHLVDSLRIQLEPFNFIRSADLTPLTPHEADTLKQFSYRLEISRLPDVTTSSGAERFLNAPKPEFLSTKDYDELAKTAERIRHLAAREDEIEKQKLELALEGAEARALKTRILRQLEIVEAFISDPETVDGIEDYEGAFAPRNLSNLKKLSEFHKKSANK